METEMKPTYEELLAQIAKLERKATKTNAVNGLWLKVSDKGAVSLGGINARFPVTLYADQWKRVLGHAAQITEFIAANSDKLSTKPVKESAEVVPAENAQAATA